MAKITRTVYKENPFIQELKEELLNGKKVTKSGNNNNVTFSSMQSVYQKFLQVTPKLIQDEINIASSCGNGAALWVLALLKLEVYENGRDVDCINLTHKRAKELSERITDKMLYQATFSKAISRLASHNIIANSSRGLGWYWINPSKLFNGNLSKVL